MHHWRSGTDMASARALIRVQESSAAGGPVVIAFRCPRALLPLVAALGLAACGGGGGGSTPAATASLSANPTSVAPGGTTTLTWSSTNATSCTAGGGWSGTKGTSGSETSAALNATTSFTLTCTGSGGTSAQQSVSVSVAAGLTINGKITFDRPSRSGNALDYNNVQNLPARGITVEILQGSSGSTVLATTTTDASGNYSVSIGSSQTFRVRAKAEMKKTAPAPTWAFQVLNNTNGNALYVLDSSAQSPSGSSISVDLKATLGRSGPDGTTVDPSKRTSAPFAILDTFLRMKELLVSANATIVLPPLDVYWSPSNTATTPSTCSGNPNPTNGQISTTFFLSEDIPASVGCPRVPMGVYVLGDASDDSDEFDGSVVAHESGHYYQDAFSRDDSMGGSHDLTSVLDQRVAFSEGWGDAFQSMVLNDSFYRDTWAGGGSPFSFDLEADATQSEGWFSEASVGELIWDVFDSTNDGSDAVSLGFTPIHLAMTTSVRTTNALDSIHVLFASLIANNPSQDVALRQLRSGEKIEGTDDFATGENNAAGLADSSLVLPLYTPLALGTPVQVTSHSRFKDNFQTEFASYNRAGGRRYLRVSIPSSGNYRITAQGPLTAPTPDPDFHVYRQGVIVCSGEADSTVTNGLEDHTCSGAEALQAGEHVIEVYECSNIGVLCAGTGSVPRGDTPITVIISQVP